MYKIGTLPWIHCIGDVWHTGIGELSPSFVRALSEIVIDKLHLRGDNAPISSTEISFNTLLKLLDS